MRERKGRYYVYRLENVNGEVKERYVGSSIDVVESYEKMKLGVWGYPPLSPRQDSNLRQPALQAGGLPCWPTGAHFQVINK